MPGGSIPAQSGQWSFAPQAAKIGRGGTFTVANYNWYRERVQRMAMGTIQGQQVFPLEVGGVIVPTGAYKDSQYFGGEVDTFPRLENTFGWLLEAALGTASSVTGVNAEGVVTTGVNTHIFRFDPNNSFNIPWLAARCEIPGSTSVQDFGEVGFDCKVGALSFTIPNRGKVAARVSVLGRAALYDEDPTWTYANSNEDSLSTADVGRGAVTIAGVEHPFVGAVIEFANNLTTPDQEMIIGDFNLDDLVPLTRGATIRLTYKWQDPDLYQKLLGGTASAEVWSSLPYLENTVGAVRAFEAIFQAPTNIGVTSTPYSIRFRANRVFWAVDSYPVLQGGDLVYLQLVGTVLEPSSGDYFQILVENNQTGYVWPV